MRGDHGARDQGASVIVVDQNHDIGGHAMVSGGRIPLGGGTRLQKKFGIADSADQVYLDHTDPANLELRYSDRDLVRVWADENAATFDFLLDNGVQFEEVMPTLVNGGTVPRLFRTKVYSDDLKVTINGSPGSGLGPRAREERSGEGRRDPAASQPDAHRAGRYIAASPGDYRDHREQAGEHRGEEGLHHRDRRLHQQRGVPEDVRSAADRGVSGRRRALEQAERRRRDAGDGDRRGALGHVECRERAWPIGHQDAPHRRALRA